MDHSVRIDVVRPWRTATIVASAVAAIELVVIVVAGIALLGSAVADDVKQAATAEALAPVKPTPAPTAATRPMLPREETAVMVLNGNGRSGAAAEAAQRVRAAGHPVASVGNAPRTDYGESVVMFRPGSHREARRLARAVGVRVVGPLDGVRLRDLMGAQLVIVVGN